MKSVHHFRLISSAVKFCFSLLSNTLCGFPYSYPGFLGRTTERRPSSVFIIFMNGGITIRITFTLQIDFHTPIAVNSIVRMIYFLNLCLDFCFKGTIIRLPVFPVVVISIWACTQPSKQPANAKFIMILFNESISL